MIDKPIRNLQILVLAMMTALPAVAHSQSVVPVSHIIIKPNQLMKDGKLIGCGIDVKLAVGYSQSVINFFTVSFWSVLMESALVGYRSEKVSPLQPAKWTPDGVVESAWVRIADKDAIKQRAFEKEASGYASAGADVVPVTMAMLELVENGVRLQTGVRMRGASSEVIYSGVPSISEPDRLAARECLGEMMKRGMGTNRPN